MLGTPALVAADDRIARIRQGDLAVHVLDPQRRPLAGRPIHIRQSASDFYFGTCISADPASSDAHEQAYLQYIRARFTALVCENAMKWYAIGKEPGAMDFARADQLLQFARQNRLAMRGHCLFWSKQRFVQQWVQDLSDADLRQAIDRHLEAVVGRYRGQLIAWDVYNEMLDGSYYESRLGQDIAAHFFRRAHQIDPRTPLFVNEYNIIDSDARTEKLIQLIARLRDAGAVIGGIGIQEHAAERFSGRPTPPDPLHPERANMPPVDAEGMLRRLDRLGELGLPIHLTEISFCTPDAQQRAEALETFLRLAYSHPAVKAIMLWGFWEQRHWLGPSAALVDGHWNNLPAGQRLDQLLLQDWRTHLTAMTDAGGIARFRGFFGRYEIEGQEVTLTETQPSAQCVLVVAGQPAPRLNASELAKPRRR